MHLTCSYKYNVLIIKKKLNADIYNDLGGRKMYFSRWRQQIRNLCLKYKSLNINLLFIELFIKSISHLQSCWYLEKNITLRVILTISDDINMKNIWKLYEVIFAPVSWILFVF